MYPKFEKPTIPKGKMHSPYPKAGGYHELVEGFENTVVMPENRRMKRHKRF